MGLHCCKLGKVAMLAPVNHPKSLQWACECKNWTIEQWKKVSWSDESQFILDHVDDRVRVRCLLAEEMAPGMHYGKKVSLNT